MNTKRLAVIGAGTLVISVSVVIGRGVGDPFGDASGRSGPAVLPAAAAAPTDHRSATDAIAQAIDTAQAALKQSPDDAAQWAALGSAYVEQGRATADPAYYPKADGALHKSLTLQPADNLTAMVGMGMLANARHDFATAKDWADKALAFAAANATAVGVLVDADTQLGDYAGATAAAQRMLDLRPGVAAFTRASYDAEQHGHEAIAKEALQRALADATTPADTAFCHHYLGELAFNSGDPHTALTEYRQALHDDATYTPALASAAKAEAALGDNAGALRDYEDATARLPLPQYVLEYGELLESLGRSGDAKTQYAVLDAEQKLFAANGVLDDLTTAQFLSDHGDPQQAVAHARAEWGRRHSVLVADALAWALHKNGQDSEAIDYARQAAALGWPNSLFAYHRGVIEAALGRPAAARADLAAALSINPDFSPLQGPQAHALLARLGGS
ncbi:tetratricopeptide repeat protein [Catenulispora yoronensis]|uniref:Tetratricopeptide repeat protein n=1 Tax=Catenulispora yoronensis TaxID=450799 RepID=A0ABN2VCS4_9ACTN